MRTVRGDKQRHALCGKRLRGKIRLADFENPHVPDTVCEPVNPAVSGIHIRGPRNGLHRSAVLQKREAVFAVCQLEPFGENHFRHRRHAVDDFKIRIGLVNLIIELSTSRDNGPSAAGREGNCALTVSNTPGSKASFPFQNEILIPVSCRISVRAELGYHIGRTGRYGKTKECENQNCTEEFHDGLFAGRAHICMVCKALWSKSAEASLMRQEEC